MPAFVTTLVLLALATVAAFGADAAALPLPFLLGPLCLTGVISAAFSKNLPHGYTFPSGLRLCFIAIIGLMIGAQVTPDLFADTGQLAISALALTLFVILAHSFGYVVLRKLGRYDRATAFYGAAPGGLFESIAIGEDAGADPARLTLQQFLRIIAVVTLLPIGLSLYLGAPVGSAAGVTLAKPDVTMTELGLAIVAAAAGIGLGAALRFPARQLTGPMAVAAALSLFGWWHIDVPIWLVKLAQIVVGTALGMRFAGLSGGLVLRGAGLTLISVGGMLALAAVFAVVLMPILGQPFDVLLISFAPGGVTEMSLVALSLSTNPAFVTVHHIFRILITVLGLTLSARLLHRLL